jgi:hypothetical protein
MDRREALKQAALLAGYSVSAAALSSVWQGCSTPPSGGDIGWEPQFFNTDQAAAMAEMAETILPRTDTPGAKDVKVPAFVDQFAAVCMKPEEQQAFRQGLLQLLGQCEQKYGRSFLDCRPEERLALLNAADEASRQELAQNQDQPEEEHPFFLRFKGVVLLGYFSSEQVGKEVTAFLPIPGGYKPCMPYEEGQPIWTIEW